MTKRICIDLSDEKSGVTGTCQLFNAFFPKKVFGINGPTENISFIADCGTFQSEENEDELNASFGFDITKPEFGLLTHGHLDHYGKYPLAIKKGFQSPIFTTYVTKSFLSQVFLDDCLKIETKRAAKHDTEPLYSESHINTMKSFMIPCPYHKRIQYNENICIYFFDNGHVPGAAVTLIQFSCAGYENVNILISGDYNDHNTFFKVHPLSEWVYNLPNLTIILESTYGSKKTKDLRPACFIKNIVKSLALGKTCIVPTFSFVRTQEVNYALKEAQINGKLDPRIPIYNDGKTAIGCTQLFLNKTFKMYPHTQEFLPQNTIFVDDKQLRRFLKHDTTPKVIVSSSGMGSHGPSQSYIEHFKSMPDAVIHATGHLSPDSKLGSLMKSNDVAATIFDTDEFSAHGKQDVLIKDFVEPFKPENVKSIILHHGDPEEKIELKNVITDNYDIPVYILSNDITLRITSDGVIKTSPRTSKLNSKTN